MSCLGEHRVQHLVQLHGGGEIAPERLLDDHPRALGAAGGSEALDHRLEHVRGDRQVVGRPRAAVERLPERLERRRVVVVAVDVAQQARQLGERVLVVDAAAVFGDAVAGAFPEVVDRPRRRRDADHRHVELALLHHRVERGEDLLVREVTRHPEEHEGVGAVRVVHFVSPMVWPGFSSWPPNSLRIADNNRSAKSALPRDVKRA